MIVAGIDPGTRALGIAWARVGGGPSELGGVLASVLRHGGTPLDLARAHARREGLPRPDVAGVESMRWRPSDASSQPNDLIDVQTTGILFAHEIGAREILPIEVNLWKKNLPKTIHHNRIAEVLTPTERLLVSAAVERAGSHAKEALDALGILLYMIGRIDNAGRRKT